MHWYMLRGTVLNKQAVPGSIGDLKGGIDGAAIRKCQKFWEKAHIKQGILQEMVSKITVALRRPHFVSQGASDKCKENLQQKTK